MKTTLLIILSYILLISPSIYLLIYGNKPTLIHSIVFLLLFVIAAVYQVWIMKKLGIKFNSNIKKTHTW